MEMPIKISFLISAGISDLVQEILPILILPTPLISALIPAPALVSTFSNLIFSKSFLKLFFSQNLLFC